MPTMDAATAGLVLGITILVVDLVLLIWLLRDRASRITTLTGDDARHFASQDGRRAAVLVVLLLLAIALAWGSRIPPMVDGRPNTLFLQVWMAAIGLICLLSLLAFFDWFATRFYARRRRLELLEEGVSLIEQERRARKASATHSSGPNGHHGSNGAV